MAILRSFQEWISSGFQKSGTEYPIAAGLYPYLWQNQLEKARLHLRVEKDGFGTLLVNAARVYHLNPTATLMAYQILEKVPPEEILKNISYWFKVTPPQAKKDLEEFSATFFELIRPDGACPVCELELETTAPFSKIPSAPYRMDLALTYRCNNDCFHCYNDKSRQRLELNTGQWMTIIDRLWETGIPHLVFTGGEPTLRPDLPDLVAHAQKNGQITGLNTNGRSLKNQPFLKQLVDAGLDHVQITLESQDSQIHDTMTQRKGAWQETVTGIQNALQSPLFVMTNTTLLKGNSSPETLKRLLDFLAGLGVPTVGLNALIYSGRGADVNSGIPENDLPPLLELAREATAKNGQRLIWYTPTQYCHFDPIQLELGVKGCTAALYNMCVEPDGSVLPCQSYYHSLGNIIDTPWQSIWEHDLAVSLRERRDVAEACRSCALLPECGGGCPLARKEDHAYHPRPVTSFQLETLERRR